MTFSRKRRLEPVPHEPSHRRVWRSLWRRCSCGLPAPCVDRLVPAPQLPFPQNSASPPHRSAWFSSPQAPEPEEAHHQPTWRAAGRATPPSTNAGARAGADAWPDSMTGTAAPHYPHEPREHAYPVGGPIQSSAAWPTGDAERAETSTGGQNHPLDPLAPIHSAPPIDAPATANGGRQAGLDRYEATGVPAPPGERGLAETFGPDGSFPQSRSGLVPRQRLPNDAVTPWSPGKQRERDTDSTWAFPDSTDKAWPTSGWNPEQSNKLNGTWYPSNVGMAIQRAEARSAAHAGEASSSSHPRWPASPDGARDPLGGTAWNPDQWRVDSMTETAGRADPHNTNSAARRADANVAAMPHGANRTATSEGPGSAAWRADPGSTNSAAWRVDATVAAMTDGANRTGTGEDLGSAAGRADAETRASTDIKHAEQTADPARTAPAAQIADKRTTGAATGVDANAPPNATSTAEWPHGESAMMPAKETPARDQAWPTGEAITGDRLWPISGHAAEEQAWTARDSTAEGEPWPVSGALTEVQAWPTTADETWSAGEAIAQDPTQATGNATTADSGWRINAAFTEAPAWPTTEATTANEPWPRTATADPTPPANEAIADDEAWRPGTGDPAGDVNPRRLPHHGQQVRAPAWAAPTVLMSQVGRAGDLTPAQAYRAGRGRSW
jgi:hypothetical protein